MGVEAFRAQGLRGGVLGLTVRVQGFRLSGFRFQSFRVSESGFQG